MDDFQMEHQNLVSGELNVSISGQYESVKRLSVCQKRKITSITKNDGNDNNMWSDKLLETSGIIAYLSRVFSSHMRPLSLHLCQHYFFN